ncbi:LysR family transcriptional regulator [Oceanicella sp. SM1341]|uniref:LysR family transcriptional regulator n=1 Tax=Oceanicella sp. SM1341 TaxID=1548889 RepID=UPI000E517317|nr:LysR family transcriptional regulator [Oceanicella sp. SM1341]
MDPLLNHAAGLLAFVRTVETGSFSAAARATGTSPSAVSRSVARLERRLGTRLFNRSTRALAPTAEGRAWFERVAPLLRALADSAEAAGPPGEISGTLRVSLPGDLARLLIGPLTSGLMRAHPGLGLELSFADRRVDVVREGFDLAVRVGRPEDSELTARPLGRLRMVLVAAPALLARHGRPADRAALAALPFVRYMRGGRTQPVSFATGPTLEPRGPLALDAGHAIRSAALHGAGAALLMRCVVAEDIAAGTLEPLLPDDPLPDMPVTGLHAFGRLAPRRLRAFCDVLEAEFARLDPPGGGA